MTIYVELIVNFCLAMFKQLILMFLKHL